MSPQTQTKYFQYWRVYPNLRQILFGPRAELELGKIIWGRGETIDELVGGGQFFLVLCPSNRKVLLQFYQQTFGNFGNFEFHVRDLFEKFP